MNPILLIFLIVFIGVAESARPNVVLIITDDQDVTLGGMTPMKSTAKLLGERGTTFVNSFVASPICCPSRSSILTGSHVHNHMTVNNSLSGGCYGAKWRDEFERETFATALQKNASYVTFYAGKYLNQYGHKSAGGPQRVPPGWNEWRGLVGNSVYYNFTLSVNGQPKEYNDGQYLTEVIKDEALQFIDSQFKRNFKNPFLIVVAPPAPHAPFTPAPQHKDAFNDVGAMKTPNFNIPVGEDKHWLLRMPPNPLPNSTLEKLDRVYRSRWQTLLSVDEMVEAIVKKLEGYNILDGTYVIFTSDNGYHMGQFSQPVDKRQPYETDIRVPLIVRGPSVESGARKQHPTINVDLAPTIMKMAGLEPPAERMDGYPLPIFADLEAAYIETNDLSDSAVPYERQMLIEYRGEGSNRPHGECPWGFDLNLNNCDPEYSCKCEDARNNSYDCIRHLHPVIDFVYCEFGDAEEFEEAYDLSNDPHQLKNVVEEMMPGIRFQYQNAIGQLSTCKGSDCYKIRK